MAEHQKPRLQPISRDTKFNKLKSCNCFEQADYRLRLGWSFMDVARFIQDNGEYTDVSLESLRDTLARYYDEIPATEKGLSPTGPVARKIAKELNDGLDEVAEMRKLFEKQSKRIDIDMAHEENMNKLIPGHGKEVLIALKILETSAQLKMDLGITKRQLGQLDVNSNTTAEIGERYNKESVSKVMADPESRRRVLMLAERLVKNSEKHNLNKVITEQEQKEVIDVDFTESTSGVKKEE